ncbi:MAG: FKBP-type peptidyl-prolyl cis-trans isomerase [Chitinophagaceae bacterium]
MRKYLLFVLIAGILITSSCLKSGNNSSTTCNYDACQVKAPDSQIVRLETYLAANSITAQKHCSGMYYTIVDPGAGSSPTSCSDIAINYTGMLTNGNVFDKTTTPVVYNLLSLITGWKNGLPLIKKGGKIRLYIPPALGYGPNPDANGVIPGSSILIFDVELLEFQ